MIRKNKNLNTSGENVSPDGGLKPGNRDFFYAIILNVDPTFEVAQAKSFSNGILWLQYDSDMGLKKNDVVLVGKSEGFYHVIKKSHVSFRKKTVVVMTPENFELDERYEDIDWEKDTPDGLEFPKKMYIKKKEGDIVRHIKQTGYKIAEKFVSLFSGVNTLMVSLAGIFYVSHSLTYIGSITDSLFKKSETGDEGNSNIYNINIFKKNNIPYKIEISGDCLGAIQENSIKIEGLNADIEKIVEINIILSENDSLFNINKVSYNPEDEGSEGGTDSDINEKALSHFRDIIQDKFSENNGVVVYIENIKYNVASIEYKDTMGNKIEIFKNKKQIMINNKTLIMGENRTHINKNDFYSWGAYRTNEHIPQTKNTSSYKIDYSESLAQYKGNTNNMYFKEHSVTSQHFVFKSIDTTKESSFSVLLDNIYFFNNKLIFKIQDKTINGVNLKANFNIEIDQIVSITLNERFLFLVKSLSTSKGPIFGITNNSVFLTNIKNFYTNADKFISEGDSFFKSSFIKDKFVVGQFVNISKTMAYFNMDTIVFKTNNTQFVSSNIYMKANKNITAFVDSGYSTNNTFISMTESSLTGAAINYQMGKYNVN